MVLAVVLAVDGPVGCGSSLVPVLVLAGVLASAVAASAGSAAGAQPTISGKARRSSENRGMAIMVVGSRDLCVRE